MGLPFPYIPKKRANMRRYNDVIIADYTRIADFREIIWVEMEFFFQKSSKYRYFTGLFAY